MGAIFVLLLYFFILMRLIQNAQTAADLSGSLIIMGVVAVLTFQIAVNVGMVIGFMPVTGIPLPLMSYGGSSVLFTFLALGVVDERAHAPVRKLGCSGLNRSGGKIARLHPLEDSGIFRPTRAEFLGTSSIVRNTWPRWPPLD